MNLEDLKPGNLVEVTFDPSPEGSDLVIILGDAEDGKIVAFSEMQNAVVELTSDYEYDIIAENIFDAIGFDEEDTEYAEPSAG